MIRKVFDFDKTYFSNVQANSMLHAKYHPVIYIRQIPRKITKNIKYENEMQLPLSQLHGLDSEVCQSFTHISYAKLQEITEIPEVRLYFILYKIAKKNTSTELLYDLLALLPEKIGLLLFETNKLQALKATFHVFFRTSAAVRSIYARLTGQSTTVYEAVLRRSCG